MSSPDPAMQEELDQVYMLAQCISVMPSNTPKGPPVSVPPPMRATWGKWLYDLGVRVHPEMATKQLVSRTPDPHGPAFAQKIKRPNLLAQLREINPEMAARIEGGESPETIIAEIRRRSGPALDEAAQQAAQVVAQEAANDTT